MGWFWNQRIFPWDEDIDIQMTPESFTKLISFNNTIIGSSFLIDLNPHWRDRYNYGGYVNNNVIDGRLVSTITGAYIDITVLVRDGDRIACKSPHYYQHDDIFPLFSTKLNGIEVW